MTNSPKPADPHETTRRSKKARTAKTCCECTGQIEPKTIYISSSAKVSGRFEPLARHVDCLSFAEMITDELDTGEGYRVHLVAGIKTRDLAGFVRARAKAFPDVLERLIAAGLV